MFRILCVCASLAVALVLPLIALPASASSVVFTYTLADHGQGGWGGGQLFADGTAGGANGVSFFNGADVATFAASSWSLGTSALTSPSGGPGVDICGTLTVTKSNGFLPPPGVVPFFCLSFVVKTFLPITGQPIVVSGETIRVTPVG